MSKTKKRLIIAGSIVGALIVLILFFGLIFNVKGVEVDFATATNRVEEYDKSHIIQDSRIEKGSNLLFADYSDEVARLEKLYPYARFQVVRNFPNKVIIYVYERKPVFRILDKSGFWQIYDENLKCLEIVAPVNLTLNGNDKLPILSGVDLDLCSRAGLLIKDKAFRAKLDTILDGVYAIQCTDIGIMSNITFDFNETYVRQDLILTVSTTDGEDNRIEGAKFVIEDTTKYLKEKIAQALDIYFQDVSYSHKGHLEDVTITIKDFYNPNNILQNSIVLSCECLVND